jgi:hypothetical protein
MSQDDQRQPWERSADSFVEVEPDKRPVDPDTVLAPVLARVRLTVGESGPPDPSDFLVPARIPIDLDGD